MIKTCLVLFLLFFNFLAKSFGQITVALPKEFEAKVIGIKDGDTYDILYKFKKYTVRLAHIDCPEKAQAYGQRAKNKAAALCFGKKVKIVQVNAPDRNQRLIVEIFVAKENVNQALVKKGLAWHYKIYSKNLRYAYLEKVAKSKSLGLWKNKNPTPPWQFRKSK